METTTILITFVVLALIAALVLSYFKKGTANNNSNSGEAEQIEDGGDTAPVKPKKV